MDRIRINCGNIVLDVNDEGETISFNPKDLGFIKDFAELTKQILEKDKEYRKKYTDSYKESVENADETEALDFVLVEVQEQEEFCVWCDEQIDKVFGPETCRKVFQGARNPELYASFLEQITPYIQGARKEVMINHKKKK